MTLLFFFLSFILFFSILLPLFYFLSSVTDTLSFKLTHTHPLKKISSVYFILVLIYFHPYKRIFLTREEVQLSNYHKFFFPVFF